MKLLMVTVVEEYRKETLQLFKKAKIENFSGLEVDGYKILPSLLRTSSWFPIEKGGAKSILFFSFTDADKIDKMFQLIEIFNNNLETNNPVKAVVIPIEKHI
ncbi:MAG: hypothetical protein KAJ28_05490 [Flavobacteriaceae bacterium]|nr:hypothetical protein [Flavobacteriaceae bacterium]